QRCRAEQRGTTQAGCLAPRSREVFMNNLSLWLACGLLSLLAMAFVVVPLLRQRVRAGVDGIEQRRLENREVYGQRLRELDAERDAGLVTPEDEARVRAELQRAFLRDMEALD